MDLSQEIEIEFLASILQGKLELDRSILEQIEPDYFSVDSYVWLAKKFKQRSWKNIAEKFLDQLLLEDFTEQDKRELYKKQLSNLYSMELTFVEDAKVKFVAFVAFKKTKASMSNAFDSFDRSKRIDYLLNDLSKGIREAENLITEDKLVVYDYAERYKERENRRVLERDNPNIYPISLTGIKGLDDQFQIKGPVLVGFLAPFKRYKSIILNTMGYSGLIQGQNVFHVTYENSIDLTEGRYDAMFFDHSYDRLMAMALSKKEKEDFENMFEWINSWKSRLKIIKCQAHKHSVLDIMDSIDREKDRSGFSPDRIIIDYMNIMSPIKNIKEERLIQQEIVWNCKDLADKENVPIFTAFQAKMEANKSDRLDRTHMGKSIDISQGIDYCIALNQSKEEADEGILVISPLFVRSSAIEENEIVCNTDFSKMMVCSSLRNFRNLACQVHK